MKDTLDAFLDKDRGVIGDFVIDPLRERSLELFEDLAYPLRAIERVAPRRLVNPDDSRRLPVQAAERLRQARRELDAGNVADAHERTVRIGAHDNRPEFLDVCETALGLDIQLKLLVGQCRLRADATARCLDIRGVQGVRNT